MELSRNLRVECVDRLVLTPPHAIESDRSVRDAVAMMRSDKVGYLLVCRNGTLTGIFTERDLLVKVLAAGLPLAVPMAEVMTANPVTVGPKDPIRVAVKRMEQGGYRHLPVVGENGKPLGMLASKQVVHYLVEHFPATVYNQPPDPASVPGEAEGA
ncbi:MAG TPA: CBS domain-containing protein [Fimbriiglobus sp.]|jgi:CBS domain-containing protein